MTLFGWYKTYHLSISICQLYFKVKFCLGYRVKINVQLICEQNPCVNSKPNNIITKTRPCNMQVFLLKVVKIESFLIFAQNKLFGEAVLMSTHNLSFESKITKIVYPSKPQFYYIKWGLRGYTLHGLVFLM